MRGRSHTVCEARELSPGDLKAVTIKGRSILVICSGPGRYHALSDTCPHQGAALSSGRVERAWCSNEVGRYESAQNYSVVCPWHNFEFDVGTGEALVTCDRRLKVKTYSTQVEDGHVVVLM